MMLCRPGARKALNSLLWTTGRCVCLLLQVYQKTTSRLLPWLPGYSYKSS